MKNFPWTVRMPLVIHFLTLGTLLLLVSGARAQESDDPSWRRWYQSPAEHFEQCRVMGNGRLGISIFGGVATDSIYLNDITLRSGEPLPPHISRGAKQYLPKIREALDKGDYRAADSLSRYVQGSFSQSYLPMGTLYIEHGNQGDVTQYTRELDLEKAVSTVRYRDRKSTRLNSSHVKISYAVFCLKK